MLKFTQEQEWVRIEGDMATDGITQRAQELSAIWCLSSCQ